MPVFDLMNDFRVSPELKERWMFAHQVDHNQIFQAVQTQFSVKLVQYRLYPYPENDKNSWLQDNQRAHDDFNGYLGLDSSDLQSVDFKSEEAFLSWLQDHYREHQAARLKLGI